MTQEELAVFRVIADRLSTIAVSVDSIDTQLEKLIKIAEDGGSYIPVDVLEDEDEDDEGDDE